ncbi:hypothetical protein O7614_22485 [Micromonospora sp. WMMD961]|uniref:hypothetical protein n=1 Tax=Micromonospora sp. WMMD961 TaxID=3016100 RepID=UPI002416C1CA|nr:hypothetical protein [Micromonospora sp. WMMD961]MDG4782435.1 hypothetical protein [Micromonospora sp. WMMD961]
MPECAASPRKHYRETNIGNQARDPDQAIAVTLQALDADDAPFICRSARSSTRSLGEIWLPPAATSTPRPAVLAACSVGTSTPDWKAIMIAALKGFTQRCSSSAAGPRDARRERNGTPVHRQASTSNAE